MAANPLRDPYRDSVSATETLHVLREMNTTLDSMNARLDSMDTKLDKLDKLDAIASLLEVLTIKMDDLIQVVEQSG